MPIQSRGSILPGGGFAGSHSGYQIPSLGGVGGFGFGDLLQQRMKMQQEMHDAQLALMKEQRLAAMQARDQAGDDALRSRHIYQTELDRQKEQDRLQKKASTYRTIGPDPGSVALGPSRASHYRTPEYFQQNALTGDTRLMYAPEGGSVAGGSSTQGTPSPQSGLADAVQLQSIAALQAKLADPYGLQRQRDQLLQNAEAEVDLDPTVGPMGRANRSYRPPSLPPGAVDPSGVGWGAPTRGLPNWGDLNQNVINTNRAGMIAGLAPTFEVPQMSEWDKFVQDIPNQVPGAGSQRRHGGYIPETGKYKLHKGEMVLSPEQTAAQYPGLGPDKSGRKSLQKGSVPNPLYPGMNMEDPYYAWLRMRINQQMEGGVPPGRIGLEGPLDMTPDVELGPGEDFGESRALMRRPESGLATRGSSAMGRPLDMPGTRPTPEVGSEALSRDMRTVYGRPVGEGYSAGASASRRASSALPSGASAGGGAASGGGGGALVRTGGAAAGGAGGAGRGAASVSKAAEMGPLKKWGLIGGTLVAGALAAKGIREGEGLLGGGADKAVHLWSLGQNKILETLFGEKVAQSVWKAIIGSPTTEEVNRQLKKLGEKPLPEGALEQTEKELQPTPSGPTKPGTFGPSEAYREKVMGFSEESKKWTQKADELEARASQLEQHIFRNPHADNKAMKQRVKSYRDEAKAYRTRGDQAGAQFTEAMQAQMKNQTEVSKVLATNRQRQVGSAMESLRALYGQMVKNPDTFDEDQFVQGGMMIMSPYLEDLAARNGASREEMVQMVEQALRQAVDDPSTFYLLEAGIGGQ